MKGKLALLLGGAAGYVLGTRAGKERYEQIKSQAQKLWQNPTVQEKATQAQDFAKHKGPEVTHKMTEQAAKVAGRTTGGANTGTPPSETYPNADRPTGDLGAP
ncbi:MAG TPA: hypothetical protein VF049_20645 [Nocardioidaceae bacterium]|jgi:oxygen-dependent protoporphyrinogen oxidase